MAITLHADTGATANKTTDTLINHNTSVTDLAVGDIIIAWLAIDNGSSSFSLNDGGTASITWAAVNSVVNSSGVEVQVWKGEVTSVSGGSTLGTLSWSWTTSQTAKVAGAHVWRGCATGTVSYSATATGTSNIVVFDGATHAVSSGQLVLSICGTEQPGTGSSQIFVDSTSVETALGSANTSGQGPTSNIGGNSCYWIADSGNFDGTGTDEVRVSGAQYDTAGVGVVIDVAASGTNWTKNLADSYTLSDAIVKKPGKAASDTITLSDSITTKSVGKGLSDTVTLSDNITPVSTFVRTASDTITLSDSISKQPGLFPTDSITLSDSIVKSPGVNLSDIVTLTDGFTSVSTFVRDLADTITLTDSISNGVFLAVADTITLSDVFSKIKTSHLNFSDTITLSDNISKQPGLFPADTITLSDSMSDVWTIIRNVSDTITLTDALSKSIGRPLSDSVSLTDAISKQPGLSPTDTINLSDNLSRVAAFNRSPADTIFLTDSISKQPGLTFADTITLSDVFDAVIYKLISLADTITLSDNITSTVDFVRDLSDTVNLTDALSKGIVIARADGITLSDATAKAVAASLADSFSLSDSVTKDMAVYLSDNVNLSDLATPVLGGGGNARTYDAADTIIVSDHLNITLNGVVVFPAKTKRVVNVTKVGHVPEEVDTT